MHYSALKAAGLLLSCVSVNAIELDVNSVSSIKAASKTIVGSIVPYLQNTSSPGALSLPYYWWEGGLTLDHLVNYWSLTGDNTYNELVQNALWFQVGAQYNYMPANQTKDEGNDDQIYWGLAAMTAAERGFPTAAGQNVSWAQLAINVFDSQTQRWDTATCNGGLRWQIFSFNNGWDYKNSPSNGGFLQLATRLARFTNQPTYLAWAQKTLDWTEGVGLVDTKTGIVYDGTTPSSNCSDVNHLVWSDAAGLFLEGAAYAYNQSHASNWAELSNVFLQAAGQLFTTNGSDILVEVECEAQGNCDLDEVAYKSVLAAGLASARDLVATPNDKFDEQSLSVFHQNITAIIQKSAVAAAAQCTGGSSGTECGLRWYTGAWDGTHGLGQELDALAIILANLPTPQLLTSITTSTVSSNGTAASGGAETNSTSNSTTPTGGAPTATPYRGAATDVASPSIFLALSVVVAMSTLVYL